MKLSRSDENRHAGSLRIKKMSESMDDDSVLKRVLREVNPQSSIYIYLTSSGCVSPIPS